MNEFKQFLIKHRACSSALEWLGDRNAEQAWTECHRSDWMFCLVEFVDNDALKKEIVRIALECAKLSLPATSDCRVHDCCHAVERWLAGEAVDLEIASQAADLAASTAQASAAAWAAHAAVHTVDSALSNAWTATSAAAAAGAASRSRAWLTAHASTWSAVYDAQQLKCADIVRKHISWSVIRPFVERNMQGK